MFQMPAVVLSLVIATLCALVFYVLRGKALRQLAAYWVAGLIGFFVGQWLAGVMGWRFLVVGQVHPLEGVILALAACYTAARLVKVPA